MHTVRHNWLAIVVAAVVYFMLGGLWFTVLKDAWLAGIGRTMADLQATAASPAVAYCVALAFAVVIAVVLSWAIQASGPQTAARGAGIAIFLWFGFVLTTFATEYAFEARGLRILAINTGYPLVGMMLQGAILGAWKKKA